MSPIYMPNFLKEMREMTYISLPRWILDKTKLELGNLVNLEKLLHFSTKNSSVWDLQRMTKLRNLSIYIKGKGCAIETLSSSLRELRHLEDLIIDGGSTNDGEGFVLDCVNLKQLDLTIYMPRLSDDQHFPSHFTTIHLRNCCLEEDPMPILEKLLHLYEIKLSYKSFSGRRMVCLRGGFPQLQKLSIEGLEEWEEWIVEEVSMPLHSLSIQKCPKLKKLPNGFPQLHRLELYELEEWKEWIVEEGSMPFLYTLKIWNCPKLKKLPDGLRFIYSLKDLSMDKEWKERLSEGGEDYYKVKHIPYVKFNGE